MTCILELLYLCLCPEEKYTHEYLLYWSPCTIFWFHTYVMVFKISKETKHYSVYFIECVTDGSILSPSWMVSLHSGVCGALVALALPHIFYVISSKVHLPRTEFLHGQNPSTFQVIRLSLLSMRRKCCQKFIKKRKLSHF